MKLTQIERLANTLTNEGYELQVYSQEDLNKMLFLLDYDSYYYGNVERLLESYEDVELYEVESFEELAEIFVDKGLFGDIPDNLINYLDYEKIGRDLSYDNYYEVTIGETNYIGRIL